MIIGFVAPKGSGKTTACNIIKKHLDDVVQINFKDALIEEIKQNFPDLLMEIGKSELAGKPLFVVDDAKPVIELSGFDWLFNSKPPLIRTLMQNYGTNVRRADDADYWVSKWTQALWEAEKTHKHILTDDVRFLNESSRLRGQAGILIRLERTDLEQTDTHLSETEQKEIECDYTITVGKGELDKLESELIKILDSVE